MSNCVNCGSAKTKQGQADIQALTNKISITETRLEAITTSNPDNQPAALTSTTKTTESDSATNSSAVASIAENKISDESSTTLNSFDSNTGRFADVFV